MTNPENHWIVAKLERFVQQGMDAEQIADIIISSWQLTEAIFIPIIGKKSAAMIYQRCLFITVKNYPWLINAYGGIESSTNLAALKIVVIQQSSANAAASGGAFLQTLYNMLISLIGSALTERLLRSMWESHLSGSSAQDAPP